MTTATSPGSQQCAAFRHEALLYAGQDDFVAGTVPFIADGVAAGEPILIVVAAAKIDLLRDALGRRADEICFADMARVGRNPTCIIPAWQDFLSDRGACNRRLRGIGEPIWAGRSEHELIECQRHEALVNLVFARSQAWWLVCPYDVEALAPSVIEAALTSHPFIRHGDVARTSATYELDGARPLEGRLPQPSARPWCLDFEVGMLDPVREFVSERAQACGLRPTRASDLVLAVNELATNSLRYGGGRGRVRAWQDGDQFVCEVQDGGHIDDPLAGRERPGLDRVGGRGLWLVNHLCDLVQIRSSATGTAVRLRMTVR